MRLPDCGSVLGIDVGFSPVRRSSAVCRLDWTKAEVTFRVRRFRATEPERSISIAALADRPLLACALDGPIRGELDVIGRYRKAEELLTRGLRPLIGKPGQSSSPVGKQLNHHTNECARIVLAQAQLGRKMHSHAIHETALAEAFPSSFLGMLIASPAVLNAKRGDRSDTFFTHLVETGGLLRLLQYLLPGRELSPELSGVTNHDDRAALVCAITALCVAANDYTTVGDANGWIILPPRPLIRDWAWKLLQVNAAGGGLDWSSPVAFSLP